jgi:hypothetical protein
MSNRNPFPEPKTERRYHLIIDHKKVDSAPHTPAGWRELREEKLPEYPERKHWRIETAGL